MKKYFFFLLVFIFHLEIISTEELSTSDDLEPFLSDDQYLYDEDDNIDPNDMFVDFDAIRKNRINKDRMIHSGLKETHDLPPAVKDICDVHLTKLSVCKEALAKQTKDLEALSKLHNDSGKEVVVAKVDYTLFYRRILKLFWNALLLNEPDSAELKRDISLQLSKDDVDMFNLCSENSEKVSPSKCDEVISAIFAKFSVSLERDNFFIIFLSRFTYVPSLYTPEFWLYSIGTLICAFLVYAVIFSVKELFRSRSLWGFLVMFSFLMFIFCCIWTWRNLIREEEARRAADMDRRAKLGLDSVPSECLSPSFFPFLDTLSGKEAMCKRYYETLHMSASEEIKPEHAITMTLQTFIFRPLGSVGKGMGSLFKEFYNEVPILYLIPASVMLFTLFILVLLLFSGYSLNLPFFLGSIGPTRERNTPHSIDRDTIIEQLRLEQREMMIASKQMMLDIKEATLQSHQMRAQTMQPILNSSFDSIHNHLDQLIVDRLQTVLSATPNAATPAIAGVGATPSVSTPSRGAPSPSTALSPIAGGVDFTDGDQSIEEINPREKSDFYDSVLKIMNEDSLGSSGDGGTPGALDDIPLSPDNQRVLNNIRDALES